MTIPSSTPSVIFEAHKSPIRFVALSNNGKYIATVSIKGTIIRLWSINGQLLKESRRGLTPAVIVHMSFSPCSEFLCVSSNHFTAHIFKIDDKMVISIREANELNGSNKEMIIKIDPVRGHKIRLIQKDANWCENCKNKNNLNLMHFELLNEFSVILVTIYSCVP